MNSKAIKRQLLAAIAMVLVAAVALGSSTYAWFVSNNTVKATTTSIHAQSNAAFMVIDKDVTDADSGTEDSYTSPAKTALYPAKVDENSKKVSTGTAGEKGYVMQSAFAEYGDASTMKSGTLFDIQGTDNTYTIGTADAAAQAGYALKQTFYIGEKTGTTELVNLRVSEVVMTGTVDNNDLSDAMRVLVICGDNWIVYNGTGTMQKTNITVSDGKYILRTDAFKGVGTTNQVKVDMYVYYDGDVTTIRTNNLTNLQTELGVTVSFTADNNAAGGSTGSTGSLVTPSGP